MDRKIAYVKRALKDYAKILKERQIRVSKFLLYGSYASGKSTKYSDIDVIVVSADLKRFPGIKRQEMLSMLTMNIEAPLEVLGYTPHELKSRKDSVFGEILGKTGIEIILN